MRENVTRSNMRPVPHCFTNSSSSQVEVAQKKGFSDFSKAGGAFHVIQSFEGTR